MAEVSYGKILTELRTRRGLSKRSLAKRASISRDVVGYIESESRVPTTKVLSALFTVLNPSQEEKQQILLSMAAKKAELQREKAAQDFSVKVTKNRVGSSSLVDELAQHTINFSKLGATESSRDMIKAKILETLINHGITDQGVDNE